MVGMDDYFSNNALIPPGHPQCRCVVDFVETPALVTPAPQPQPAQQPEPQKIPIASPTVNDIIDTSIPKRVETNTSRQLEAKGIEYRQVKDRTIELTEDEIIRQIAGGDQTRGSCASVALAYCGQKNGWDVLDFRDGESREFFSYKLNKLNMFKELGVTIITEDSAKTNLTNAKKILKRLEEGKEYYLSVGRHAAIVRVVQGGYPQYLELQDGRMDWCGWCEFQDVEKTLKYRFGCSSSSKYYATAHATDISQLNGDKFRTILGYINTDPAKQKKGTNGSIK